MAWQIDISPDNSRAVLDLTARTSQDELSVDAILAALREKQVPITPGVEALVDQAMNLLADPAEIEKQLILAQAIPPQPGADGYFEWAQVLDPDQRRRPHDTEDDAEPDRDSYYERSSIIIVGKGDTLGVVHPPTQGQPGADVLGQPIDPPGAAALALQPGANVQLSPDGSTFIAGCDGMPKLEGGILSIDPTVDVPGDVDFSTGNIRFSGNIHITGDIKDLFEVITEGDISVGGTVEAARIECGGALSVGRGIAGKEKGFVTVRGDLTAKYLSNVEAWVDGEISVDSEIVNSDLNCRGKVTLSKGGIHGGHITAAGTVEAPIIGSPAAVRTVIRAAVDPFLGEQIEGLREEIAERTERMTELMPRAKVLLNGCGANPSQKLKEMAARISCCKEEVAQLQTQLDQLIDEMDRTCNGTIIVHKTLYPGVVLHIGSVFEIINNETIGPLEVVVERSKTEGVRLALLSLAATAR